jgi:hypothetical protein
MVRFTVTRPKERIDVVNNGVCHTEGLESFADRRLLTRIIGPTRWMFTPKGSYQYGFFRA